MKKISKNEEFENLESIYKGTDTKTDFTQIEGYPVDSTDNSLVGGKRYRTKKRRTRKRRSRKSKRSSNGKKRRKTKKNMKKAKWMALR